ncbi:MAG: hypothetical protein Kow0092_37620 [Deferrisomatales bacterium]
MYAREIGGIPYTFGVSGLLWNANVLMYDHQTESLWSQVKREAVAGPRTGTRLRVLGSTVTTWRKWRRRHPKTAVLSLETGHARRYDTDPYEEYYRSRRSLFSLFRPGPGEEAKELVAGLERDGQAKAYPLEALRRRGLIEDVLAGRPVTLRYEAETDRVRARAGDGTELVPIVTYWFVWKGIHPETERFPATP